MLWPKVYISKDSLPVYDAILLTVKGFALRTAMEDMAPAVGPNTMILPVLNGMRHVQELKQRFGEKSVVGCVCKVATILRDDGSIAQLSQLQSLANGDLNGEVSDRIKEFHSFANCGRFDARLSDVVEREMWEKWLLLAAVGTVTCLMRGNIGEVLAAQGGREIILRVLQEVTSIINAVGTPPAAKYLEQITAQLTDVSSVQTSSMYRDLPSGRRLEVKKSSGIWFVTPNKPTYPLRSSPQRIANSLFTRGGSISSNRSWPQLFSAFASIQSRTPRR